MNRSCFIWWPTNYYTNATISQSLWLCLRYSSSVPWPGHFWACLTHLDTQKSAGKNAPLWPSATAPEISVSFMLKSGSWRTPWSSLTSVLLALQFGYSIRVDALLCYCIVDMSHGPLSVPPPHSPYCDISYMLCIFYPSLAIFPPALSWGPRRSNYCKFCYRENITNGSIVKNENSEKSQDYHKIHDI